MDHLNICDAISQGILFVDDRGHVAYCNRHLESIFGMTPEEVLKGGLYASFPKCKEIVGACLKGECTGRGEWVPWRGKSLFVRTDPVWEGKDLKGVVVTIQDLSDKERDVTAPRFCGDLNWLDAIIDGSYDGLWICDRNGTVIRVNKATERINQIRAKDVIGKNVKDLVSEGLFDQSVTLEVLKRKAPVTMMQSVRGGRKVLVTGNPIFNDRGDIVYVLTNDRDLTEMDQLRHELQETQALAKEYLSRLAEIELKGIDASSFVCRSKPMQGLLQAVRRVAHLETTILLLGESGSGKGMVAKLIHKLSQWSNGPFVRVDCTGIPETLIESELFGYERGAFTGAKAEGKAGLFELADKGTLFLDEIGEIPLSAQSKLLRFLEDHEIIRVGGTRPKVIQTRIIAATNRNIEEMVGMRLFRQDLFYRIHVVPITIPPLRERQEDILPLAFHFLKKFNQAYGKSKVLSQEVIDALLDYDFPGNVRELMNLMERLIVSTEEDRIEQGDLPGQFRGALPEGIPFAAAPANRALKEAVVRYERLLIQAAARKYGSQQKLAEALGVDRATVSRKLRRYGIRL